MSKINYHSEFGKIQINFDPTKYKTASGAAKAFHKALLQLAKDIHASAASCVLWTPKEAAERGYSKNWMVSWEEGCYEWAIGTSFECNSDKWYSEPYHSYDLQFYNN